MSQGVVMTRSRKTVSSLTRPPVFCNRLVKGIHLRKIETVFV